MKAVRLMVSERCLGSNESQMWGTGCGIVNWRAEVHGRLEKEACVLDAWFRHRRIITPPKIKQ